MRVDEYIPFEEKWFMDIMQGKSRMEQDQILGEKTNGQKI